MFCVLCFFCLGGEFRCPDLTALFQKYKINRYFSYQDRKCAIIERYNKTIQILIYKLLAHFNSHNWLKFLPIAEKIYLTRIHSTIGMSPTKAELKSSAVKLRQVYNRRYAKIKRRKPVFSVGDEVRIAIQKTQFARAYGEKFTRETFIVTKVLQNQPIPRYQLTDKLGNKIIGTFFANEMTRYRPSDNELYKIDKILKKRKNPKTNKIEYLVKWLGYSDIHNSWVDKTQIKNI